MEAKLECKFFSIDRLSRLYLQTQGVMQTMKQDEWRPRVIVISGPTAVGKTALSLKLARLLSGEIISADSMQVYRGMDIGSAKPSVEEQRLVRHHMIDIRGISDAINVAQYCEAALSSIRSVVARSKVPIVVGGSGFYLDALIHGAPTGPEADPFIRAHLESEIDRLGTEPLYERIKQLDPEYAKTISHGDRQKIVRALEIMILTQCKVSQMQRHGKSPLKDFSFQCYFFHRDRKNLYDRINARCDQMLQMGLLEEVSRLMGEGLFENPSAMQAIGYRQSLEFLKGTRDALSYEHFCEKFKQASRQYAKRQMTWFRKQSLFQWIDLDLYDESLVIEKIAEDYHSF